MVAIVSGNSLGLELTSLGTLGSQGLWGFASQGNNGEQVYVNAATGNLVVQRRDEFLASHGLDNQAIRTYNSLGLLNDDNADNWALGVYSQQLLLTSGTINTAGSTLSRTGRDGSQATYTWDASRSCYVATAGAGAHDTITYVAGTGEYTRTDGSTREVEKYTADANNGPIRLRSVTDADGNTSTYGYTGNLLTSVVDKSGETVTYTYSGTKLTKISTKDASGTVTRNSITYSYDTNTPSRLSTVTVDLTPEDKSITDGKVYKTTYTYDGTSTRIKTLTQDDGSSLTFTYDASNRVATITDALGSVTSYAYTANRTTVTDPMGKVWLYDYDASGQLTKLTSPAIAGTSITQSYSYDTSGNVTSITNGDGEVVTMTYDANGNQTAITDALGNTVTRTYSAANQLLTETSSNAGAPAMVNQGGMSIVGSDIVKTGGTDGAWDSSVRSSGGLTGGASVFFRPAQNDKGLMVGLNSDPGASHGYDSIDYAMYCTSGGNLYAYENGAGVSLGTSYEAGDDLRVTYDGSKVIYLKGTTVLRTVTVTISGALYADTSFREVGGKIGSFYFSETPTSGTAPFLAESNTTVSSNGTVVKTGGINGNWDSSVRGLTGYVGNAMVSFKPSQTNLSFMVGLNTDPAASDSYSSIDYAYYCTGTGELRAYESGVSVDLNTTYSTTDTLRIVYAAGKIQYLKINSAGTTVVREVTVNITQGLYLDSSFCSSNAKLTELQFGKNGLTTVMAVAQASGMTISGDTLKKTGGTSGAWDSAVRSAVGYVGQAYLGFSPAQADKAFMVGLNSDPDSTYSWGALDYAFYCTSTGALEIREAGSGNVLTPATTYVAGDKLEIIYDGTAIRYFKNGAELRSVTVSITDPLYIDSSFYNVNAKVNDLRFGDRAKPQLTTRYVYSATKPAQLRYTITPEGKVTQYQYNSYGERTAQISYPRKLYTVSSLADDAVPTEAQMNAWVVASFSDLSTTLRKDFAYDARGLLAYVHEYEGATSGTEAAGGGVGTGKHTTQYIYDQAGRLLQTIQMGGTTGDETGSPTTTYAYDGLGRVLTVNGPRGAVTSTVYTDSSQKVAITHQSGAVATSTYDKAGRLISLARSGGNTTKYSYDQSGRLLMTSEFLADGITSTGVRTFNLYDEAGRQVASIDGDGTLTETAYDKAGRVTRVYTFATAVDLNLLRDGNGVALNPTLASIRPTALSTDVQRWNVYNDAGQLIYEVADDGAVTQHDYDGAGRLVRTLRYATTIVAATYPTIVSVSGQLDDPTVLTASGNRSERYVYDADGLLAVTIDAEGFVTRNVYDYAGRKVYTCRYANALPENERAGGGAVAQILPTANTTRDQVETYFYDARGLLIAQVDAGRYLTVNTYNNRGLLSTQTRYATPLSATPSWFADVTALIAGATTSTEDRTTTWYYNRDGQLLKTINFEGLVTFNEYDAAGRMIRTTQGYGRSDKRATEFRYDTWGRKTAELDAEGSAKIAVDATQAQIDAIWTSDAQDYAYDGAGRLISTTDANNFKTLYFYDVDGRLTHTVNARGEVQEIQYNALGQRTAVVRYGTAISTTSLVGGLVNSTLTNRLATVADAAKDSIVQYAYNSTGRLYKTTDAEGAVSYNSYNIFGELSEQKISWQSGANLNVDQRVEQFSYDRRGMLLSAVRDVGGIEATTSIEYDAFGRVTKSTNANGKSQTFAYDKLGRVVTTTDPLSKSVATTYDAFGQALSVTDQAGKITTYTYDRAARNVTMVTPEGVSVVTTRNAYGHTYAIRIGANSSTYYSYDRDGNLTQTKVGTTVIETRDYDAGGRLISSTNAGGVQTTYTYDAANRLLTRTVDPTDADTDVELSLVTRWEYDAKGQAIKVTDPRGIITQYTFDLDGRTIKQVVDPTDTGTTTVEANLVTTWTHDAEGRVLTVVDPNGVTTQYVYDKLGRRISEIADAGTGKLNLTRSYTYDAAGNVLSMTDARGKVTRYRYDDNGRLTYTADATGSVTRSEYNDKGLLTRQTRYVDTVTSSEEPSAVVADSTVDQVTRYNYDYDGRLVYTVDAVGAVTKNEYDDRVPLPPFTLFSSPLASAESASAVVPNSQDRVTRIEYDAFNRETFRADPTGSVTRNEYDLNGNLIRRTSYINAVDASTAPSAVVTATGDRVERFSYDGANRLVYSSSATGAVTHNTYDKNGNLTEVTRYAKLAPGADPSTVVADADNDRVVSYFYDRANRRTWVVDESGHVTQNMYDDAGHLVRARRYLDLPSSRSTPSTVVASDTVDRIQDFEYDNAGRLKRSVDVLGNDETYTYDGAGNRLSYTDKNDKTWTYTYDAAGRQLTTTDPLGKSVTTAYDSFGQVKSVTDQAGKVTTYTYDLAARNVTVLTAEGVKTVTTRNVFGEVYSVRVGTGNTSFYYYDGDGNLTQTKVGTYVTGTRTYDAGGRLAASTDANGVQTVFTYDAAGQMLSRTVEPNDTDVELHIVTKWAYNAFGQVSKITDPRSVSTVFTFDRSGHTLTQVVDPTDSSTTTVELNQVTTWTYTLEGQVATAVDPSGVVTQYTYDKLGRRLSETVDAGTDKLNLKRNWTYDAAGNVLSMTDARGKVTRYRYDDNGRLTYTADAAGSVTRNEYTVRGQLARQTRYVDTVTSSEEPSAVVANSTLDQVTRYYYDDDRRLQYVTDALGSVTKSDYDDHGNLITITRFADTVSSTESATAVVADPDLDQITRIQYDGFNRETYRADPMGSVTRNEYDLNGNVIRRTSFYNTVSSTASPSTVAPTSSDRVERFIYDAANRLVYSSTATGAVTQNVYDKSGNLTQVTRYATLAPDAEPDTVVVDTVEDRVVNYFYDRANRRTWMVDERGYVTQNMYDDGGRLFRTRRYLDLPDSRSTPSTVVANDTNDRIQDFEYDNAGRLTRSVDALGNDERYTYDGAGNKLTFTNKNDDVWTYTYDAVGRLLTEKTPAVRLYTMTRNADGTLTLVAGTADEAITTTLKYDSFGNLTSRTEATGRDEERTTSYAYDKLGRQVKVTFPPVSVHAELTSEVAGNLLLDEAARDETLKTPFTQTFYDSFGNAVSSTDRNGYASFKTYDAAGRVRYEIDALGFVTRYTRNAFGEATSQRRYATATTLANTAPTSTDPGPTTADVDTVVNAAGFTDALDRTLSTSYDKMGRVTVVYEPVTFTYNSTTGQTLDNYGKRTYTVYNAFGEAIRVGEAASVNTSGESDVVNYQFSYFFYDRGGNKTAAIDAGRYLTTFTYDYVGNLKTQVEYSTLLSTTTVADAYAAHAAPAAPTATSTDRSTTWSYDKLNRKTAETKVDVDIAGYSSSPTSTALTTTADVDLATTFGYDAVGNQIWAKDAAGAITRTYYDALGRTSAIVAPSRSSTVDGEALLPVIDFKRDAYGNVLAKYERANTATSVTDTTYAITSSTADRITRTLFDTSGNAREVQDAQGYQHYNAYTADGKVAKSWQTVADNEGDKSTIYTAYYFDKLGRLVNSYAPSPVGTNTVSTNYRYNGFGEVTARGKNGGWQEYFEYDNAGRLWKTNADNGQDKVYLYDLLGRQTAEITSAGSGRSGSADVATTTSAEQAESWGSTRRVEIEYDALGHVIERREAERVVTEGGITTRTAAANASIAGSTSYTWEGTNDDSGISYRKWSGANTVNLSWTTLAYLGGGDVRVDLTYMTLDTRVQRTSYDWRGQVTGTYYDPADGGSEPGLRIESQIFSGNVANTGVSMVWDDATADRQVDKGGISEIRRVIVYKRNVNGDWVPIVDREPAAGRPFGNLGTQVEISSPVDPTTSVKFNYRKTGTTEWTSTTALSKLGDSHWFNAAGLSGTYDYQVVFTPKDGSAETTETGNFVAGANDSGDSAKTSSWERPIIAFQRDRWGNALKQSDPRNQTWFTEFTYNRDNQVVTEKRPDASNGDINSNSPTRTIYYDRLGHQVAIKDALGHINGQYYDGAGNLAKEVHADGGVIANFFDAFGQKVQSVDALGNAAGVGTAQYALQTTRYAYDKLGRLLTTTHGNTTGGAVSIYGVDANDITLVNKGKKDLQEKFAYDAAGRKLWQSNGAGEVTKYWYDRAGNVIKTQLPGGEYSTATFDTYGHKATELDANRVSTVSWKYDYFGQLLEHTDLGGAEYTYVYDTAGQLTRQTNTRGQDLSYSYDAAGQLIRIGDASQSMVTTTAYDMAGHHIREKVLRSSTGEVFQDNHLAYDTLGRLIDSADNRAHITFAYDKADNRTKVTTHTHVALVGDNDTETVEDSTRYFLYDAMNRQVVVDGIDDDGNISSAQGHKVTYDKNGNRLTDKFWGNVVKTTTPYYYSFDADSNTATYVQGNPVYTKYQGYTTETYSYDALDRLQTVDRDGTLVDVRWYDAASRVVQSGPNTISNSYVSKLNEDVAADQQIGMDLRRQVYDLNGRMLFQRVYEADRTDIKFDVDYRDEGYLKGYDDAGNVLRYRTINYGSEDFTTTVTLAKFENYAEAKTTKDGTKSSPGSAISSYDKNGYLIKVDDTTENSLDKDIVNDAAGRVLRVDQYGNRLYTHIVNGEILGKFGVGPNEVDPRTSKNKANFQQVADFDLGYRSITGSYPAPSVGAYTVRQGDNLQSIARAALGDANQWWRVAQANGLSGDRDLRVGQTLTLPSTAAGTTNTATSFKPYNASDVVGDTSPNIPQPKGKGGCGGIAQIVMIVVAIVVTIYTCGAAATWLGPMMSGTFATVGGVGLSAAGAMTVGAIGAAVGSVASQMVGVAMGATKFSWKQVATSAIGGAVTAGIGGLGNAVGSEVLSNTVVKAALSSAVTQGIGVATGLQKSFSWTAVAAAAAGSMMGSAVRGGVSEGLANTSIDSTTQKIVTGTLAGIASGATMAIVRGGQLNMEQISADAFGNALGESVADAMQSPPDQSDAETARLKRHEDAALEQEAADNRTSLNAFNREHDSYYERSFSADAEERKLKSSLENTADKEMAKAQERWDTEDRLARRKATAEQNANADEYRRQQARAAEAARARQWAQQDDLILKRRADERLMAWDGGAGAGRGFVNPPAASPVSTRITTGSELGDQLVGGTIGVVKTGWDALNGLVRVGGNTVLQIGDILTFGMNHDSPIIQQAWIEQGAMAAGVVRLATEPRTVAGEIIEKIDSNYAKANKLHAEGRDIEASIIYAHQTADIAATVLGGFQGVRDVAKLGAAGMRELGVQDFAFVESKGLPGGMGRTQRGAVSLFDLEPIGGGSSEASNAATAPLLRNQLLAEQALDSRIGTTPPGAAKPITVTAEGSVGGQVFFDTNQTARPAALANPDKPTLIADLVPPLKPNSNMRNAHAEVGTIQQAFDARLTEGADMSIVIRGQEPLCSYCSSDVWDMASRSGLNSLKVVDTAGQATYVWDAATRKVVQLVDATH